MATIGRTLLRFTGAVLLGASATSIDNPAILFAPTTPQPSVPEQGAAGPEVRIAPGKLSLTFRFDDPVGFASMAQPNGRVDIVVMANDLDQQKPMAKLFLENVRLLAIAAMPQRLADGGSISVAIATIEVTPEEAERFRMAKAKGSLQLVLRGYGDPDSVRFGPKTHVAPFIVTR